MAEEKRKGCKDMWNAYMVEGATWSEHDIPNCPTTASAPPHALVSYSEAKTLCNKAREQGIGDFRIDAYVHFYIDDQKFVGERKGIWTHPDEALEILGKCEGMITPDFSTYADFPDPIKRDATYKMRAFGYYASKQGLNVINNVRWGTSASWEYCFDGIPRQSIVAIGTVASDIWTIDNRPLFEDGLTRMVQILAPETVIVYGSARNKRIEQMRDAGVEVVVFPSRQNVAYKNAGRHE